MKRRHKKKKIKPVKKMKRAKKEKRSLRPEVAGLLTLGACLAILLSLISFTYHVPDHNYLGLIGYCLGFLFNYLFGLGSYLVLAYAGYLGWKKLCLKNVKVLSLKTLHLSLFLISVCMLLNLFAECYPLSESAFTKSLYQESVTLEKFFPQKVTRYYLGGSPLYYLYRDLPALNLQTLLSNTGIFLTFFITSVFSFALLAEISLLALAKQTGRGIANGLKALYMKWKNRERKPKPEDLSFASVEEELLAPTYQEELPIAESEPTPAPVKNPIKEAVVYKKKAFRGSYKLPPLSLLTQAQKIDHPTLKRDLRRQADILEETLKSFGIEAKVGAINCGPTITSFEVHPPIGVKVQKIKVLENDIALNLQAKAIRIIAPIPGKAAVGVEVPSLHPQAVNFREMLGTHIRSKSKACIPILLGKTVSGEDVTCDLTKMPHCIIAGATGSGKSVCINTLILSILMTARPDEVKLLLIDPKKVELSSYTKLPHMIAPVITEAHGANNALKWLVKEMQDRYELLKQCGLRNIEAYNNRDIDKDFEDALQLECPEKLPYIVTIIDEFADLMMASTSDLETPIARIAQMARAVGIHLILATQRPSREVITGIIKANFPSRISFKVSSRINSQIILDENGAETLLGNGDMLFLPPGTSNLIRAQGAFASDSDLGKVIDFILRQAGTDYQIKSFDHFAQGDLFQNDVDPEDSLYGQALTTVLESGSASTTFLQRKLKVGYARAASLMDALEARGVISPPDGAKPRKVLMKQSDL